MNIRFLDSAAGGFALTATHFFKRQKVSKRLCPGVRPARWGSGFLRYGTDPGAAAPVCSAAPTLAVYDCVVRSLRSHPRIDPVTKPAEGAKDQKPDQKQKQKPKQKQKQKQKPDQKIAAFGSSYSWIELPQDQAAFASKLAPTKRQKQRSCPRRSRTTQQ
ncbi:hypothetical protein [Pseudomonas fluorescens]|uniref:hypothetical protein n=1 Tax=Pseudomonas fluorescens TaxID=294 RepID=UPI00285D89FA|nr:hypothetical protein [Pseudomonas fluorescens]MDR6160893.1 hypothetical protein [Pseudomonas fluorescens]